MSKFYGIMSRRDFMKTLGVAGAGVGAAAVAAPAFADLDAVLSAPESNQKNPWWVKQKEIKDPSCEIDWGLFEQWEEGTDPNPVIYGYSTTNAKILEGKAFRDNLTKTQDAMRDERLKSGVEGYDLKANALSDANGSYRLSNFKGEVPWDGPVVTAPEKRGVSKWSGTVEEATSLLRAASHFFGSPKIGVAEIDSDTRKLFRPKASRFEDTDKPRLDGKVKVIPDKFKWVVSFGIRQPIATSKLAGLTAPRNMGPSIRYANANYIGARIMAFIKGLGYEVVQDWGTGSGGNAWGRANVAHSVLSGIGELSRNGHDLTHEWGTSGIYQQTLVTNMPLAPTNPIDAGMFRFCKDCMTCAKICQEINGQTPLSMDREPTYEITGPWNRKGIKRFQIMWPWCTTACPMCDPVCPFTSHNMMAGASSIHELVKVTQAHTGVFNSFFASMEESFGFGMHWEPEDWEAWWKRDLNTWKYDDIWGDG